MTNLTLYIQPICIFLVILATLTGMIYIGLLLWQKTIETIELLHYTQCTIQDLQRQINCYTEIFNTIEPQMADTEKALEDIEHRLGFMAGKIAMLETSKRK